MWSKNINKNMAKEYYTHILFTVYPYRKPEGCRNTVLKQDYVTLRTQWVRFPSSLIFIKFSRIHSNLRLYTQECPNLLRNPKVHYRVHKSPPLVSSLYQINPAHNTPTYSLLSILILFPYQPVDIPSGLIPSGFSPKNLYVLRISPMCVTCVFYLILINWLF
jgi:hypothetical protein